MKAQWALLLLLSASLTSMGQTSWKGTTSTAWGTAGNWTAGVPTAAIDAIIGDANFTGTFKPTVNVAANCKSLTIGATGAPVLTQSSTLTVAGNLTIGTGGTISQGNTTLTLNGNWSNAGTFTTTNTGATVVFAGTSQTIGGTVATPFRRLTVNATSTVTLNINTSVTVAFAMNGTFIPAENATPYLVSGAGTLALGAASVLKVNAATFAANYGLTGTITLTAGCTVDYSATLINQTVKENLTYSTLKISGAGVKTPAGNLTALNATSATTGNITVSAGTLDLATFTANRGTTVTGGTLTVSNGATLEIGGTNPFPLNYNTRTLGVTGTVEYGGTNQTVSAQSYGNLTLSSSSGAAVKTMPATALTIAGNLTSTIATGTSVSFTAAANITVNGNMNIGVSTTFAGATFTHIIKGGFTNNGTVTGSGTINFPPTTTQTITLAGTSFSNTGTAIFGGTGVMTVAGAAANLKNITIQSGASIVLTSTALKISGSITNSGTFTANDGSIELNGSTAQVISANTFTGNTIKNLTINNAAGVTLSGTLQLSGILKVTTGQLTTGGFLTLLSTSTQTALIDGSGAGEVVGNVTMQRYLASGFGYKYFSSPFQAATVNQFSDDLDLAAAFPTFYTYLEDHNYTGWTNYTTTTGLLTPMLGYAANFGTSASPKTVDITGAVNNHTVTSPTLYNHNQPYTLGFNLAGNPYPSPVDWDASSGWTRTNIDNAVYYFNAGTTNQYTGSYSSYINGVSSDGIANNIIPAMQGFFVHVTNGTYPVTATFSVNNPARVNNLTDGFHRKPAMPLLRLNTSFADDGLPTDAIVIYFDDTATPVFNQAIDALKLMNTDPLIPNLYVLSQDTARLSICALPYMHDSTSIPLGLVSSKTGWVTFAVQDMEQIPYGLHIYLRDAKTGIIQDLQRNPRYRLLLEAGKYEQRFSLIFSEKELVNQQAINATFIAYNAGGKIYVYKDLAPGEKGSITLSNIIGQIVLRQEISGNGYHDLGPTFSSGIYIVSFRSQKGLRSKKIFIGNE
ncbi:Por secretion system C-terminal sorting domain-containing protein [Chitinophaga sp. CF118]|uniref:T9SS type A sorting domain-containing protein n=1 Tax=Chitinophaga sp. CF118 TaxID=1884367 RepID=UPI0008E45427|nr:T9SS type A sorting domain-containing protein [Chitinophaga sp. CF118]SFD78700.1 Por secretion system C-terminal sorting domain-containing protein [Chitinophaga sp. CF118]